MRTLSSKIDDVFSINTKGKRELSYNRLIRSKKCVIIEEILNFGRFF